MRAPGDDMVKVNIRLRAPVLFPGFASLPIPVTATAARPRKGSDASWHPYASPARPDETGKGQGQGPRLRPPSSTSASSPSCILIGLAGIQLGLIAYTAQQAGTAARAAARTAAQAGRVGVLRAGRKGVHDRLGRRAVPISPPAGGDAVTVTVTVKIPDILLGLLGDRTVEKSATMPRD